VHAQGLFATWGENRYVQHLHLLTLAGHLARMGRSCNPLHINRKPTVFGQKKAGAFRSG